MLYSEANEKILNDIKYIEDYYYSNTDSGRRESALFLRPDYIDLDCNFPLYDCGLRKIEYDYENGVYVLYVDVVFFYSDLYKYISFIKESFSYFVHVISNDKNIKNLEFLYFDSLVFDINISNFTCILNSETLFIDSEGIDYLIEKGIKFKAVCDNYRLIKYFDGSIIDYDKFSNKFNILFANTDYAEIHFKLCGDYKNSLNFLKFIFPKLTCNKNITLIFFFECFSCDILNEEILKKYDSLHWIVFEDLKDFRKYKYKFHYLSFEYTLLK